MIDDGLFTNYPPYSFIINIEYNKAVSYTHMHYKGHVMTVDSDRGHILARGCYNFARFFCEE